MSNLLILLHALRRLWFLRYRLWQSVLHDIRSRFTGSILGVAWIVLLPAMQLSIYAILYVFIFRIRVPSLSQIQYVLLVFSGLVPLIGFSESLSASISSLASNRSLLLNTVFPAELIPLRATLSASVPSFIAFFITTVIAISIGTANILPILLIPFVAVLLVMFTQGVGWILSLVSLIARDIQHALGFITMILFVLSPYAYTPQMVPSALKPLIYLNPLSYFVLSFQKIICYGQIPELHLLFACSVLGISSFCIGLLIFQRSKTIFFDYA